MSILRRVNVHNSVYVILLMALLSGYIKNALLVILIVFFHELGHVFWLLFYGYRDILIEFYPFGGISRVDKMVNSPINKEIVIVLGGAINQVILFFLFWVLVNIGMINGRTYELFNLYNRVILVFNLLPIIPLDGSILVRLLLEKVFSYKRSYYCYLVISLVSGIVFVGLSRRVLLNNLVIMFLFVYKVYEVMRDYKYVYQRFLLERYLYDVSYRKIVSDRRGIEDLGKERYYYFKRGGMMVSEKRLLSKLFDNK